MHQKMLYLWLAVFMAAFFMNGCGQEPTGAFNNEVLSVQQPPAIGGKSGEATVDAYPQRCFSLNVPFIKQADPPGEWANTKNCGQACAVMLAGYFNRAAVTPARITAQNTWLANYTHDQRYNQANG
ncbi:MAG: hypothetical protein NTV81_01090, partial [Candidatus Komeilibacteria bacterium]|nr:hypothetical protein [Candidatus Komeilibacteria bacterium]